MIKHYIHSFHCRVLKSSLCYVKSRNGIISLTFDTNEIWQGCKNARIKGTDLGGDGVGHKWEVCVCGRVGGR
jgi:hypothetical protein